MGTAEIASNVLVGSLALLSLVLSGLAARAWAYARDGRTLMLLAGFLLLFVKAVVLLIGLFSLAAWTTLLPVSVAFDLALAFAFYVAVLR
jgi:hypothetical protein